MNLENSMPFNLIATSTTPIVVIAIYLGLLLGLAMMSKFLFRGTSTDYFVASRSIGPFMLLMSVFGTTMTAFALVANYDHFPPSNWSHSRSVSWCCHPHC